MVAHALDMRVCGFDSHCRVSMAISPSRCHHTDRARDSILGVLHCVECGMPLEPFKAKPECKLQLDPKDESPELRAELDSLMVDDYSIEL